jgi:hypothetical protein
MVQRPNTVRESATSALLAQEALLSQHQLKCWLSSVYEDINLADKHHKPQGSTVV